MCFTVQLVMFYVQNTMQYQVNEIKVQFPHMIEYYQVSIIAVSPDN